MKGNLLTAETKSIFKNRKLLIPFIAILFIPVMYAGMFLWAFWDPYEHLQDLPVAIVNEDKGAIFEGTELQLGNELVDKLKESGDFNFQFVGKKEGYENLKNQQYYILVEIPEDFSDNATTILDDQPKKLELKYVPNEAFNFLSAQIGGTAIEQIKGSLAEKITETYAETMFDKITEVAGGLEEASEGAAKLNEGAAELKAGSKTLHENLTLLAEKSIAFNEGMTSANTGAKKVAEGANSLASGMGQLQAGSEELVQAANRLTSANNELTAGMLQANQGIQTVNEKMSEMITGTQALQAGAGSLSSSLQQWQQNAEKVSSGAAQLQAGMQAVLAQLPEGSPEKIQLEQAMKELTQGTAQLASAAGEIAAGGDSLAGKLGTLNEGQKGLQKGIAQLSDASSKLAAGAGEFSIGQKQFQTGLQTFSAKLAEAGKGADQLASGTAGLTGGLDQLSDGSKAMKDGADQLSKGAGKLEEGNTKLVDGSSDLASGLTEGAEKASSVNATDKTYNMMAQPVEVGTEKVNAVPNYGTGFAPYFLSLGLFVGALLLSIVFPLREPAAVPKNAWSWFGSKFAIMGAVGIIQALIAVMILLWGLKLEVQSVPLFILFAIITSLTFITLIQFFVTAFGDPGRFVAIVILILQLTTSAGTFPLELIPDALQAVNAFFPMTYSVAGFKAVISSGDFSFMWHNAGVLAGFIGLFIAGTIVYFQLMYKRRFAVISES